MSLDWFMPGLPAMGNVRRGKELVSVVGCNFVLAFEKVLFVLVECICARCAHTRDTHLPLRG
jgi:hypothetical protein